MNKILDISCGYTLFILHNTIFYSRKDPVYIVLVGLQLATGIELRLPDQRWDSHL